jgi:phospholipase C
MTDRIIEHLVVLMLENRSFDHLFGYRPGVNGLKGDEVNLLDPTQPESERNPSFSVDNGAPFAITVGQGPGHSLDATNTQLFNDKTGPTGGQRPTMNGFVRSFNTEITVADRVKNPTPADIRVVMQCFPPGRLPSINMLADNFLVCDNWHADVPGPTQANRLFVHAATASGYAHNVWSQKFDAVTIYENLQTAGLTWATYESDSNEVREFTRISGRTTSFKRIESFAADCAAGALPSYSFIIPRFLNTPQAMANSMHAPEDVRHGDNLIADVYEALRANDALWRKSALIVLFDEHGGFYDHVAPPAAVNPDGINSPAPGDKASFAPPFAFDRLGLRVPVVIASPWVPKGRVDSTLFQHTSIAATLKEIFGLPKFLTKRDAAANSFTRLFSLGAPRADAPMTLDRAPLPTIAATPDQTAHPANHPLDPMQQGLVLGVHQLTLPSHAKGPAADQVPTTQGEASKFVRARFEKHFGKLPPVRARRKRKGGKAAKPALARKPRRKQRR